MNETEEEVAAATEEPEERKFDVVSTELAFIYCLIINIFKIILPGNIETAVYILTFVIQTDSF